ncbi:2-amino-4-hydroxy-6-hydroxymethyldihydropteridine diphosphokinase [Paludibacterium paludis]|uniref:2-amino-4-hydroxy-6-hydroxymethyldihydropteridine pyrophosphokinase n=1 Tax=Paludibacterium paludis TaxID=1225769 RepID=A0A918UBM6_9NEIS|nr:2-amino-4-hydroxy-6-hydroxymethyldihydropteridine diphosphokinase [Paludibacterium paludis]GGY26500.1 2-amino-4-hydroxy-6-hydroxymethyldihydropteridine diphosphokinase [Paludibacterium paludis]
MTRAFVALGSNLDSPAERVRSALNRLASDSGLGLVAHSSLYRTAPVGYLDQPDFVNAVAWLDTLLAPHALLERLLALETEAGRVRTFRNAPRRLDLDLLWQEGYVIADRTLTLPHPRMLERAFVMVPLAQIAPDLVMPNGRTAREVANDLAHDGIEAILD